MTWDLRGKTVLITGAARGIGAETARRAASAGANVALVGLEPEELQRVAAQCGSNAAAFEADVTDWEALERAVEGTVERFGGIDVVMANAGIAPAGMVRSVDPAAFERTVEINLLGVWRTVRACLPQIIERKGYVLVTASLAAAIHGPGMAAYAAAKAGAEAFADSLRVEVKHLGVDVGVAYFGFIDTDMVRATDAHPSLGQLRAQRRRSDREDLSGVPGRQGGRRRHAEARPLGRGAALGPHRAGAPNGARAALRQGRVRDRRRGRPALRAGRRESRGRSGLRADWPWRRGGASARGGRQHVGTMAAKRDPRMIPLGYGKYVRADRVFALVPLEGGERQDGRRTYVHVEGLSEPVVASRSERAILADVEVALAEAAGLPRRRRSTSAGQESLL